MEKDDTISKYLTKFVQCRDELGSIGMTVTNDELVSLALLGLPKSWHSYQDSVNRREKLPDWNEFCRIWCKKNSGKIPGMDLHLIQMMNKIVLWLVRQRRGKEINPIPNLSPVNMARSTTCPE